MSPPASNASPEVPRRLSLSDLGGLAAPTTLALTAMLYFAGYTHRVMFLGEFGINEGLFPESIQSTLVWGALPIIIVFGMIYTVILGIYIIKILSEKNKHIFWIPLKYLYEFLEFIWLRSLKRDAFILTNIFAVLLATGAGSGIWLGEMVGKRVRHRVASGCLERCFIYENGQYGVVGTVVAQDAKRLAVVTASGLRFLQTDEIRKIRPFRPF